MSVPLPACQAGFWGPFLGTGSVDFGPVVLALALLSVPPFDLE